MWSSDIKLVYSPVPAPMTRGLFLFTLDCLGMAGGLSGHSNGVELTELEHRRKTGLISCAGATDSNFVLVYSRQLGYGRWFGWFHGRCGTDSIGPSQQNWSKQQVCRYGLYPFASLLSPAWALPGVWLGSTFCL